LLDYFEHRAILILTDFRVGASVQSAMGEDFRHVLCEVNEEVRWIVVWE